MGIFGPQKGTHGDEQWISHSNRVAITDAQANGTDSASYHGACHDCLWKKGNAVGEGLRWCMGCAMFNFTENLPQRRLREADEFARHAAEEGYD